MQKTILFGNDVREKVLIGINKCVDAVKVTLGSNGRNVVIKRSYIDPNGGGLKQLQPECTKDGIKVLRSITLTDQVENIGSDFVKEASQKTMDEAGDATTTTAILFQKMVSVGIDLINKGENPVLLKRKLDKSVAKVVEMLNSKAIKVAGDVEKIRQVATVSANNDTEIGNLIADAFEKMGADGIITYEESATPKTYIDVTEGFKFDKGYISSNFANKKDKCELENPYILIYEKKLSTINSLEPILQQVLKENRALLIVCDDADGQALASLVVNSVNKVIKCCVVQSPSFGEGKRMAMEDIAALTGGTYISEEKGFSLDTLKLLHLGNAEKVIVGKDSTVIVGGKGDKKAVQETIDNLKMDAATATPFEKEQIEKRIARLIGGVAVLYVGANTPIELKEKVDRVDDAIRATRCAIEEGVIPGGGTAFLNIAYELDEDDKDYDIIQEVLYAPIKQLCFNSAENEKDIISLIIKDGGNFGFNSKKGTVEDLVLAGIIDPVKAVRCALQNAASSAGNLLISECLIVDTF